MLKKVFSALFLTLFFCAPVSAISAADLRFYAQNNILFLDEEDSFISDCLSGELIDMGENSKTALNFLISKGYSASSAAAIVGNLIAESSVVPNKLQGGKLINDPSWRLTSWEKYGKSGFGIAQWTSKGRQANLQAFADENGLPVSSMEAQLAFLFKELQDSYKGGSVENLNAKSLEEATFYIYRYYETPLSSFCTSGNKAGCYNSFAPSSYSDLSESATSSAYKAFANRLKYAKSALADVGTIDTQASSAPASSSLTCTGIETEPQAPSPTTTNPTDTPTSPTGSASGAKIASVAISMSWPNTDGTCDGTFGTVAWRSRAAGGTEACSNTLNPTARAAKSAIGGLSLRDCGKFVGAVMHYGQIDTSFPKVGVKNQMRYMNSSSKWVKVSTDGQAYPLSSLRPGDVIAYSSGSGDARGGHIQIWIGNQTVAGKACPGGTCKVNIASASYQSWTPSLNLLTRTSSTFNGTRYYHSIYRLASNAETNIPTDEITE